MISPWRSWQPSPHTRCDRGASPTKKTVTNATPSHLRQINVSPQGRKWNSNSHQTSHHHRQRSSTRSDGPFGDSALQRRRMKQPDRANPDSAALNQDAPSGLGADWTDCAARGTRGTLRHNEDYRQLGGQLWDTGWPRAGGPCPLSVPPAGPVRLVMSASYDAVLDAASGNPSAGPDGLPAGPALESGIECAPTVSRWRELAPDVFEFLAITAALSPLAVCVCLPVGVRKLVWGAYFRFLKRTPTVE